MTEIKNITPAMRQFQRLKEENPDAILFFRMGDFYEMFYDDARAASRILGIALTSRDKAREVPMCGVPYHAAQGYIAKLVREGLKVAVCEQVEDADAAKGIVERAVVRTITPGTALDDELLDPKSNNFIAAACEGVRSFGFAYMDVSTGEFRLTELPDQGSLNDEIRRLHPMELLTYDVSLTAAPDQVKKITLLEKFDFDYDRSLGALNGHYGTSSLDGFGCAGMREATRAAGALLNYIKETSRGALNHLKRCLPYQTRDYLFMDPATRRNLEVIQNMRTGAREGTLLATLDRTRTAMGARRLKSWLLHPLKELIEIKGRHGAVGELIEKRELRVNVQEILAQVYDIERLIARVSLGTANPRDLVALKLSLQRIPDIKRILELFDSGLLSIMASAIDDPEDIVRLIERSIAESPPVSIKDGGIIKEGYNPELDELRAIGSGGKDWIARLEAKERERTGINTLKVGYNRVFGYYIEVTSAKLQNIPPDYARKQTLANAERFVTPGLKEWEEKILTAEDKARALEAELFSRIRDEVAAHAPRVQHTAHHISMVDALSSLAEIAHEMNYVKPDMTDDIRISIEGGRHPVVEALVQDGFVANDLLLGEEAGVMILTGPNMAGKSTYLRQNALIVLMAQIGSFVPASSAAIGVVDRIFSRVGASDDLSRGQSTFMVEMNETANILNNATPRSFIILDEIGRGTSTFDGLSIAWAVVEYLHDNPALTSRTLFATHYHELTELSLTKQRVKNYNMAVKEWGDRIVFLRKVVPGGSSRSYGIQVARLAGLPQEVIGRAREILKNLESGELNDSGMPRIATDKSGYGDPVQMSLLGGRDELRDELRAIDVNRMTPIEALAALDRLKGMLED